MRYLKSIFLLFLITFFVEIGVSAQKDFDPKYEAIKPRVSYVPGIKVIRGETQLIIPMRESFCPNGTVFKFNNGDIQVYDRRSSDGGKTWHKVEHILEASTYQYPEPDGEVVMFRSSDAGSNRGSSVWGRPENSLKETKKKFIFEASFFRSKDNGLSLAEDTAKIYLTEELNDWSGVLCRKIVRIGDGSLLMSMYGQSEKKNKGRYCVLAIRSTDRGKTWHYLSTIAFGLRDGGQTEGFNETSLLVLPDGKILSFIRSSGSYEASLGSSNNNDTTVKMPFGYQKPTPIYMSISIDGGRNWSNADPVAPFGVWPDAVLMKNGIIEVNYGRPGDWIMFSKDEGESWGPVIQFYNDLYPPDCGNYFSSAEVAHDILLVVYARTDPNDHWKSEIVGTYFHVERVINTVTRSQEPM
jgi:hypothetical protein